MYLPRYPSSTRLQAFTLIELLTVIAIIGILAAIIIPTVGKVRAAARSAQSISNAKQVGVAMLLYAQDNKNKILAHSYSPGYSTSELTYRQFATYLARNPSMGGGAVVVKNRTIQSLASVADAAIPESLRNQDPLTDKTYGKYGFTWSINQIFNYNGGRSTQGVGSYHGNSGGSPRTVNEFIEPSRTLYALSGTGYEITASHIENADFVNPTEEILRPIAYYHRGGRGAAAIFLDGHTAILTFPIDPKLTQNKAFNN